MKKLFALLLTVLTLTIAVSACTPPIHPYSSGDQSTSSNQQFVTSVDPAESTAYEVVYNIINVSETLPASPKEDLKTVLKRIRASVVEVYANSKNSQSAGSGVVVSNSTSDTEVTSYIVTCHHVIENASSVSVKTIDGETYEAMLVGSDPDSDICVMSVKAKLDAVQIFTDIENLEVGEEVVAIGNPLGTLGGTVTKGIISATSREITVENKKMTVLQTDAAINSGNSGGGLFTTDGYLIGIVNAKTASSYNNTVEGLAFAIPSDTMLEISHQLMETYGETLGYIPGKYILGCTVASRYTDWWGSQGYVYIATLDQSGSFYKSGLRADDRLVSVTYNDVTYTVTNANDFVEYINGLDLAVGDTMLFDIKRGNTSVQITVTIEQYIYGQF